MSSLRAVEEGTGPGEARPPKQVRTTTKVSQSAMEPGQTQPEREPEQSRRVGWPELSGLWPWSLVAAFIGPRATLHTLVPALSATI